MKITSNNVRKCHCLAMVDYIKMRLMTAMKRIISISSKLLLLKLATDDGITLYSNFSPLEFE